MERIRLIDDVVNSVRGETGRRTLRVLVIDDEIDQYPEDLAKLTGLLQGVARSVGLDCAVDVTPTWNALGYPSNGLALFCKYSYDLIILDLVFHDQPDQGDDIYWAIRNGLKEYPDIVNPRTPTNVPIVLFTEMAEEAEPILERISSSPEFAYTFHLGKKSLRKGAVEPIIKRLSVMWAGTDLVMHVLVPAGVSKSAAVSENMMIAFGVGGGADPGPGDYVRRPRSSYRIIRDAVDPRTPPGKKDWCFEIDSMDMPMVMSLKDLNNLFMEKTGRANLAHKHPAGALGWKVIDGVAEIRFHFQDPSLFKLNQETLVLSRLPGGRLFTDEGFWD